jgi:hypothetical protein
MQQALGVLRELSFTDSKITSAKEALAVALAEPEQPVGINGLTEAETDASASVMGLVGKPEQEPVESISAEQISKMFHRLEGIDQNQWGYHWKKGWNDALREAMDYCQAAPTPRRLVELTDSEVDDLTMAIRNAYPLIETPFYVWCRHFSRAVIAAYEAKQGEQHE